MLRELLGYVGPDAAIEPPFIVITVRRSRLAGVFVNFGAVFLDPARITIGEQAQLGPYVQLLTADHPRDDDTRAAGPESAQPINKWPVKKAPVSGEANSCDFVTDV